MDITISSSAVVANVTSAAVELAINNGSVTQSIIGLPGTTNYNDLINKPDLNTYVPYTGATADVALGGYSLYSNTLRLHDGANDYYGTIAINDNTYSFLDGNGANADLIFGIISGSTVYANTILSTPIIQASTSAGVRIRNNLSQIVATFGAAGTLSTTLAGNLFVDTNLIYTDATNNRVGINKTSPVYTLDVAGGAGFAGQVYVINNALLAYESATGKYLSFRTTGSKGQIKMTDNASDLTIQPSGGNVGINTTSPSAKLDVNSDIIRLRTAKTPASAAASGNQGDHCWDASYFYICTATNTWKRAAISTW